jgi:hypothetical protein
MPSAFRPRTIASTDLPASTSAKMRRTTGAVSGSNTSRPPLMTCSSPGCRLQAPAGWLHRSLAGIRTRLVIGTNLPGEAWTSPINKDPADRPPTLVT